MFNKDTLFKSKKDSANMTMAAKYCLRQSLDILLRSTWNNEINIILDKEFCESASNLRCVKRS